MQASCPRHIRSRVSEVWWVVCQIPEAAHFPPHHLSTPCSTCPIPLLPPSQTAHAQRKPVDRPQPSLILVAWVGVNDLCLLIAMFLPAWSYRRHVLLPDCMQRQFLWRSLVITLQLAGPRRLHHGCVPSVPRLLLAVALIPGRSCISPFGRRSLTVKVLYITNALPHFIQYFSNHSLYIRPSLTALILLLFLKVTLTNCLRLPGTLDVSSSLSMSISWCLV